MAGLVKKELVGGVGSGVDPTTTLTRNPKHHAFKTRMYIIVLTKGTMPSTIAGLVEPETAASKLQDLSCLSMSGVFGGSPDLRSIVILMSLPWTLRMSQVRPASF